jgi:hypothetical protein
MRDVLFGRQFVRLECSKLQFDLLHSCRTQDRFGESHNIAGESFCEDVFRQGGLELGIANKKLHGMQHFVRKVQSLAQVFGMPIILPRRILKLKPLPEKLLCPGRFRSLLGNPTGTRTHALGSIFGSEMS